MSDPNDAKPSTDPQAPAPASGAAASSSGDRPSGAQDVGFRYQAEPGIPEWLVGKTPKEAAAIAASLYNTALSGQTPQPTYGQQANYQGAGQPQPTYGGTSTMQYPQQSVAPPTEEEWDMNPREAMRKQLAYERETTIKPQFQQYGNTLRQQAIFNAKLAFKEDFDKYGPEIVQYMNQVDPQYLTPDMMDNIVKVVRGNHIADLQREAVERARKEWEQQPMSGSPLRSGTQPTGIPQPSGIDLNSDELPEEYRKVLRAKGITERELDDFLSGNAGAIYGTTMEERRRGFFDMAKKGNVVTEEMPRV